MNNFALQRRRRSRHLLLAPLLCSALRFVMQIIVNTFRWAGAGKISFGFLQLQAAVASGV